MVEQNRPRAISGSAGSRVKLVLGRTGSDSVLLLDQDDGETKWQSQHWDTRYLDGISGKLINQIRNCDNKGRVVTHMTIDPEEETYFIAGEKRDGSGWHAWWNARFESDEIDGKSSRVALGEDGRSVIITGDNGWNISGYCSPHLEKRLARINREGKRINFVNLLPNSGYFISDSEGTEWVTSDPLSDGLKNRSISVIAVVVALDGSWVVIRPNYFQFSNGISEALLRTLRTFYNDHNRRMNKRKREIREYDKAIKREKELREEAERKLAEERKRKAVEEEVKKRSRETVRAMQIQRKRLKVGDRITAIGQSTSPGDAIISTFENNAVVATRHGEKFTIADPRLVTPYYGNGNEYDNGPRDNDSNILVLLCQAQSKYEAAVSLLHCECNDGVCECKRIAHGTISFPKSSTEPFNSWMPGQRVHVKGFADAVIEQLVGPNNIKIRYDDKSTYHVQAKKLEPLEPPIYVMQLFENGGEMEPFDEFKCAEKIDVTRLQRVINDLEKDSDSRRSSLNRIRNRLDNATHDARLKEWAKQLERCQCLEMTAKTLYDMLKDRPRDKNGCVAYEVTYEQRDASMRGRLFAKGKEVNTGLENEKYPRTVTLQGMHSDLRAPLVGAFAHDIDCKNSDVRLLCSLATQLDLKEIVPTLFDYRDRRDYWLRLISELHDVSRDAAKRLASIIVSGGNYFTWLRNVNPGKGMLDPREQTKAFAFRLSTQLQALRDELVAHPRFKWTQIDREKLAAVGKKDDVIDGLILARIVFACENEVLSILHRSFHTQGWKVRAKVFDGLIVEAGVAKPPTQTLPAAMKKAEKECMERDWDVLLEEKPLFGKQDDPIESVSAARQAMKLFDDESSDRSPRTLFVSKSGALFLAFVMDGIITRVRPPNFGGIMISNKRVHCHLLRSPPLESIVSAVRMACARG